MCAVRPSSPRPGLQALVFDFDGVLADSVDIKAQAFEQVYRPLGPETAGLARRHYEAHRGVSRRDKFLHCQGMIPGQSAEALVIDGLCRQFSALVVDRVSDAPEIPGAGALLRAWSDRLPLHLDSATPDEELAEILPRRGLAGYFRSVHGSSRTKAENLAAILAREGYDPARVLFFGDAPADLEAARKCGVGFVAVAADDRSPLAKAGAKYPVCRDMFEAARLLEKRA